MEYLTEWAGNGRITCWREQTSAPYTVVTRNHKVYVIYQRYAVGRMQRVNNPTAQKYGSGTT